MSEIPTARDFAINNFYIDDEETHEEYAKYLIDFAKLHVEAALKAASENALIEYGMDEDEGPLLKNPVYDDDYKYVNFDSLPAMEVYKPSIINAYPLINIK